MIFIITNNLQLSYALLINQSHLKNNHIILQMMIKWDIKCWHLLMTLSYLFIVSNKKQLTPR